MQHFKKLGRRWLSGLLASILIFSLIPGTVHEAQAAVPNGVPSSLTLSYFKKWTSFSAYNPVTGHKLIPDDAGIRQTLVSRSTVFTDSNGRQYFGLCAAHEKDVKVNAQWKNPISLGEFTGYKGKYPDCLKCVEPLLYQAMYLTVKSQDMIEEMKAETAPKFTKNGSYSSLYSYIVSERGDGTVGDGVTPNAAELTLIEWCDGNEYTKSDFMPFQNKDGSPNWTVSMRTSMAQSALWLAAAGVLDGSQTGVLSQADKERIAECSWLTWWHMHGASLYPDMESGWAARYNAELANIDLYIQNYENGVYFDEHTANGRMQLLVYQPLNSSYQPFVVPAFPPEETGYPAWIAVKKIDAETGAALAGAEFTVYTDQDCTRPLSHKGTSVKLVTGADGVAKYQFSTEQLTSSPMTFWVKETKAPAGATLNSNKYQVTVRKGENETEATAAWVGPTSGIPNYTPTPECLIKKVDQFGNGIGPATFRLVCLANGVDRTEDCDAEGNLSFQWVDPSGDRYIQPGEYTVTEITPPPGFKKDDTAQILRLWTEEKDGVIIGKHSGPLTFVNYRGIPIVIEKYGGGDLLPGAVFEIWCNGELLDTLTTGEDGRIYYNGTDDLGLLDGFYEIIETVPPDGYLLPTADKARRTVHIDTSNPSKEPIVFTFEDFPHPDIVIKKSITGTTTGLPGAVFELQIDGVNIGSYGPTNDMGIVTIPYSVYGQFLSENKDSFVVSARETVAPAGYAIDDTGWKNKTYHKGEQVISFEFEDTPLTTIEVLKVDANTDEPLKGAIFELRIDGTVVGRVGPTTGNGKLIIPYDMYGKFIEDETASKWVFELREVVAPEGYLISDKSWHQETVYRGTKKVEFKFEDQKVPEIIIAKKDKETGEYLPNAWFEVKIDGTNFDRQMKTDENGLIHINYELFSMYLTDIDNSGKGWTITVTEIEAPPGYNKDKQKSSGDYTQTQRLNFQQKVTEFTFEDTSYRKIRVSKLDAKTGWHLKGAEFTLQSVKLDNGGSYEQVKKTDETGYVLFEDVPNGTYKLWESAPPEGYDPDSYWTDGEPEVRTIVVGSEDPVIRDFVAKNEPLAGLRIRKVDAITDQPIPGALFRIEPMHPLEGEAIEATTDSNGMIILQDLPVGSYKITEISVPSPYIVDSTPQIVPIDNQHDDYTVTFKNNAESMLYILKKDAVTDEPLAGAWYNIHKADGTYVADVGPTGPNGYASLPGLKPGSYVVTETKAPDGHMLDSEPQTFEVKEGDSGKIFVLIFNNNPKANLWLRKVDAETGAGLEGAVFEIRKGNGEIVKQNAISDHEGFIRVNNLEAGTYFAVETKAPTGYILDDTPVPITLEYGKTEVIRIKNQQPGGIAVRKVDALTGEPLEGATFQLYSINDTPVGQPKVSGKDGYVRWTDLESGYYKVRETKAPEGYIVKTEPVQIEVKEFKTTEYRWPNTQNATITVVKRDGESLIPLAGATFGIYDMNGKLIESITTDLNGVATSGRLPLGWYKIVETKAPIGYVLNTEENLVEVKANTPATIEVTNKPDKGLIIHKYDIITKDPLPGAWFELQTLDGTVVLAEFSTDASGTVTTSAVEPGQYYLVETKAPEGYVLLTEKILVTVKEGEATVVNVDNVPDSIIEVFKTDSVTGNPIAGVQFEVADSFGKTLEFITTDINGRAYSQTLKAGEYLVTETIAAKGYVKDTTTHHVTVKEGENALLHVKNTPETVLHITKVGASGRGPVAGAVFELYETCGVEPCIRVGQYTTDEYGHAVTETLAPGIYKLKEIIAPAGYVLDEKEYEVAVKAGEYNNIIIENQEAATLTVRKIDSRTGKPIAGAVFKLETADHGLIGMMESDANGEALFTGLKAGHYIVTETQAPPGYSLSSPDSQTITVEYGINNYCDFVDAADGSLVVILKDKHTNVYLPGGHFIVIRESDQKVVFDGSTDVTGTINVGNLKPGWYLIEQTYAPSGYVKVDITKKVEILVGTQQTVYFLDETAGLTIEKVDAKNPHQTLEGARFQVTRASDGEIIGEYVTDKSGLALVSGVEPGRYIITELVAPDGYIKMDEPKTVEVKGGSNAHVTFPNMPRTSITVNVVDQATRAGIAGCIVEVWHQNGSLVNSYTSDSTGVIETQKLDNGFYVLKLIKAADGYTATITEATVEVKDASEVTHTFELISNGVLKVVSTNNSGASIPGMRFTLTTAAGKRIGTFVTGANGTYTFASLTPGYYTVTEEKAPDGYNIDAENKVQYVEVKAGAGATVTFAHSQTFGLQIRSTCQQTGAAVAGVKYEITRQNGELVGVYTSDGSGIAFAVLQPGWYIVTAIEAPKGYTLVDTTPRTINVLGDRMTTTDFVVSQQSSLRVKVVDGTNGSPIYDVHVLLKNGTTNIQEYATNSEGYITLNQTIVAGGYVLQMISAPGGYMVDSVPKSIDVLNAETTEIVWKLYKDAGQIQVKVTSSDYNENLDLPAGTPLQGAVFEITNADTYLVVGQMISDSSGIAASAGLPIGRYTVKMVTAPAYYGLNTGFKPEVRLKVNNDVVRVETSVKSVFIDTQINQKTNTSVTAGSTMRVDITNANNVSDTRLDDFFIHLKIPTNVARIVTLEPGTWDAEIWYSISYKTNMQDYRVLAPNLLSSTKYTFDLSSKSLGLASSEYVTDVRFEFGTVPTSFKLVDKTAYSLYVLSTATSNYKLINDIEIGGRMNTTSVSTNSNVGISGPTNNPITGTSGQPTISVASGQWVTDTSSWTTSIVGQKPVGTLPKTGY